MDYDILKILPCLIFTSCTSNTFDRIKDVFYIKNLIQT